MEEVLRKEILRSVKDEKQRALIWDSIRDYHPWVLQDQEQRPMHPIIMDQSGVLRWEKDKLMDKLAFPYFLNGVPHDPMINLNKTMFILDKKEERELARRIGYSLYGYEELSYVQERLNKL